MRMEHRAFHLLLKYSKARKGESDWKPDFPKITMNNYKKIGILGGMGPEATSDLYMKIIRYFQKELGAIYDRDFSAFLIYSVPIPDVVESIENERTIIKMLSNAAITLEKSGCDFIVIACNSVQYLLPEIKQKVNIPIIGIAETIAKYSFQMGYKSVGILGTQTTINKKVYDSEIKKNGMKLIRPLKNEQTFVTRAIMEILAGKISRIAKKQLIQVIKSLEKRGADVILLACTELPLAIKQKNTKAVIIDCTKIYADEAAKRAI